MRTPLDFYFDFSSPYAYFAAQSVDDLAAKYGCAVKWHAVLLGVIFKSTGATALTNVPSKRDYVQRDWARISKATGVPYAQPPVFPIATQQAARAFMVVDATDPQRAKSLALALYRAYFVEGRDISALETVLDVCVEHGLDRATLAAAVQDDAIKNALRDANTHAIEQGVFGAPFMVLDGEPFWGWDRLPLLESALVVKKQREATILDAAHRRTYRDLVDEAYAQVRTLTLDEARAKFGHPDVQFVDVRDVRELEREGAVPGALHAPRGMLEFWIDPSSPYFKPVFAQPKEFVFFCAAGWRSALATKAAQDLGLPRVSHIDGGFTAWKAAGAPVETKTKPG